MRIKAMAGNSMGSIPFVYKRVREIQPRMEMEPLVQKSVEMRLQKESSYELVAKLWEDYGYPVSAKKIKGVLLNRYCSGQVYVPGSGWMKGRQRAIIPLQLHFALKRKDKKTNGI